MDDIAPALLEKIRAEFLSLLGDAAPAANTYEAAGDYAETVGAALAEAFQRNLSSDILPDGKMYWNIADRVVGAMLEQDYELVSDATVQIQQALNDAAGIGLKAQAAPLNDGRIDGLLNMLCADDDFDNVAWVLNEPVKTFSRTVVDETLETNASFQAKAGLVPKVTRRTSGMCCATCARLAGVYSYDVYDSSELRDMGVFWRHNSCRCVIEYDPGSGKIQNSWTKKWTTAEESDKIEERKQLERTANQKAKIQKLLKLPSSKQISIPAKQIDTSSLGIDLEHIIKSGHTATKESAIKWIKEAKFSVDVWDRQYTRFIAQDGATYVNNTGNYIKTAFSRAEFTPNLIEALEVIENDKL